VIKVSLFALESSSLSVGYQAKKQANYQNAFRIEHVHPTAADAGGSASDHLQLLQRLEMFELQAGLDAQNITQLQERNK
jgi:hypothetical protein